MNELVFIGLLVYLLAVLFAVTTFILGTNRHVRSWLVGVVLGLCCFFFIFGSFLIAKGRVKAAPDVTPKEEYFYHVRWEGSTKDGKTFLLAEDSSGKLYYAEISQPLGIKEIPVMEKEKFKELFPAPKNPATTGK